MKERKRVPRRCPIEFFNDLFGYGRKTERDRGRVGES